MPFGLILLVLLVGVPIIEVAAFIEIGGLIGLWPTIALIILTAVAGTLIIRWQGIGLLASVQRQTAAGELPVFEVFSGICLLVAGALLLTPGFITDSFGFLLLWPPLRRLVYRQFGRRIEARAGARGPGRGPAPRRPGRHSGDVIEGEFEELDDSADMPPPKGGWDRR